eukprot:m.107925 g.107925  ORF g.107925 m.107925 type:complete len:127 (+) comp37306_c0_seq38:2747-3127(+)
MVDFAWFHMSTSFPHCAVIDALFGSLQCSAKSKKIVCGFEQVFSLYGYGQLWEKLALQRQTGQSLRDSICSSFSRRKCGHRCQCRKDRVATRHGQFWVRVWRCGNKDEVEAAADRSFYFSECSSPS